MIDRNSSQKSAHVLVVEDEALVRMSAVASLEDLGCTAIEAGSSDEAIGLIRKNPDIRVLFTDIQMPGTLDGLELAKLVRHRWPSISVVISSGRVFPPRASLPAGVRFIAKPYYQHDLEDIAKASGC
jgi:two-component system, response regulator PdtaR